MIFASSPLEKLSRSVEDLISTDLLIFTAIIGRPDQLMRPAIPIKADYICITNQPIKTCQPWQIIRADNDSGREFSRLIKTMLPNRLDIKHTIWVDGGTRLINNPLTIAQNCDIAAHRHFHRVCAYQEIRELVTTNILNYNQGMKCARVLLNSGYPANVGLHDTSILYRRSSDVMRSFNEHWWDLMKVHGYRDQVWYDFLVSKFNLVSKDLLGKTRDPLVDLSYYGSGVHYADYRSEPFKPWLE